MTPLDLDKLEAEAKEMQKQLEAPGIYAPNCDRILTLISELRQTKEHLQSAEEALKCFVFDEEIPAIGKSYWLDEHDLKLVRAHFEKYGEKK